MSWEPGNQATKLKNSQLIYDQLEKLEGELSEEDCIYWLGQFLKENITFTTRLVTGVRLYPFQHIAIKGMMSTDYFLGVWGRGFSKTFTTAIFATLHAIINPGVKIGILSPSFRQSKAVIEKILEMTKKPSAAVLRDSITHISKMTDQWILELGQSSITALPLGDGGRIRGFRFQCIVIDEFLLMPEKIYNEVIIPFLGVVNNPTDREDLRLAEDSLIQKGLMTDEERYKWPNNKLIALSSASYTFEYLYKVYKKYCDLVLDSEDAKLIKDEEKGAEDATRAVMKLNYEFAPPDLYDKALLKQAKETMSQSQIDREFRSIFTDDSGGYFKIKKMEEVTLKGDDGPFAEIKGEKGARYIVSLDPSWAENDNSDDFAVSIFKINEEQKVATLVHAYAMPGESPKNHVAYFTYILENFNVVFIIGDYMGSVQFFATFNESDAVKKKGLELKIIEGISFDDSEKYHEELPKLKGLYNLADRRIVYLKYASSGWIRYANELLAANIDHKKIWFANDPRNSEGIYKERLESNVNIENLIFDRKGHIIGEGEKTNAVKIIDLIEISYDNIRATKVQTALVQITTSAQGTQSFDLPVELKKQKGPNRPRKDSYSALVLGNWAFKIFSDMEKYDGVRASNTFVPFMI